MNIAIGCDEAAFEMKEAIKNELMKMGHIVNDYGVYNANPVLYPDIAVMVAESIVSGKNIRGILLCGTGIGMAICANKVPGIRAAVCHDIYSAERSRKSNDAQIMCLGARVIGLELAKTLVRMWMEYDFASGASVDKIDRIMQYESQYFKK